MTMKKISKKRKVSAGQSLTEYGLILALIAVFCIGALQTLGGKISVSMGNIANQIK